MKEERERDRFDNKGNNNDIIALRPGATQRVSSGRQTDGGVHDRAPLSTERRRGVVGSLSRPGCLERIEIRITDRIILWHL